MQKHEVKSVKYSKHNARLLQVCALKNYSQSKRTHIENTRSDELISLQKEFKKQSIFSIDFFTLDILILEFLPMISQTCYIIAIRIDHHFTGMFSSREKQSVQKWKVQILAQESTYCV